MIDRRNVEERPRIKSGYTVFKRNLSIWASTDVGSDGTVVVVVVVDINGQNGPRRTYSARIEKIDNVWVRHSHDKPGFIDDSAATRKELLDRYTRSCAAEMVGWSVR